MDKFVIKNPRMKNALAGILFILSVATINHFLFSHLGFNPTDDGFLLAGSRRIVEGQIPYRDFISTRTVGSLFFHAPFVLFGGDYVFLISRYFVWIQLVSIAWVWSIVIARTFKVFQRLIEKFAVTLVAFSFSAHYFPIMAWYTIDGIFFVSLGIILCYKDVRWLKMAGYLLIGIAPLCKQSFLPMIPIAVILLNDYRQLRYWIAASIPIVVYSVYLAIFGALHDAIFQLTIYTNVFQWGVASLINNLSVMLGIIVGGLAAYLIHSSFNFKQQINITTLSRLIGVLILFGIIFGAAWMLARGYYVALININILGLSRIQPTFGIFGTVIGVIIYSAARERKLANYSRCGLLIVFIAWCTSISAGYRFPALATGPLILFLIASGHLSYLLLEDSLITVKSKNPLMSWLSSPNNMQKIINIALILSVIVTLGAFVSARQTFIYREKSASHLTYDLGDVMPGATGIKTNKNTYSFLADLENAKNIAKKKGKNYCIIPDAPANWVKDPQANPLSTDWPRWELGHKELLDRAISDLEDNRGSIVIIVQKYETSRLADELIPLSDDYPIVNYVRSNFEKIGETPYFELYE